MTPGERVRDERLRRGWSVRQAAQKAGIGLSTWRNVELGLVYNPHIATTVRIEEVFGWKPGTVLGRNGVCPTCGRGNTE